jgi:hypothetical protein
MRYFDVQEVWMRLMVIYSLKLIGVKVMRVAVDLRLVQLLGLGAGSPSSLLTTTKASLTSLQHR